MSWINKPFGGGIARCKFFCKVDVDPSCFLFK